MEKLLTVIHLTVGSRVAFIAGAIGRVGTGVAVTVPVQTVAVCRLSNKNRNMYMN